jgi:hypothetical protein
MRILHEKLKAENMTEAEGESVRGINIALLLEEV